MGGKSCESDSLPSHPLALISNLPPLTTPKPTPSLSSTLQQTCEPFTPCITVVVTYFSRFSITSVFSLSVASTFGICLIDSFYDRESTSSLLLSFSSLLHTCITHTLPYPSLCSSGYNGLTSDLRPSNL